MSKAKPIEALTEAAPESPVGDSGAATVPAGGSGAATVPVPPLIVEVRGRLARIRSEISRMGDPEALRLEQGKQLKAMHDRHAAERADLQTRQVQELSVIEHRIVDLHGDEAALPKLRAEAFEMAQKLKRHGFPEEEEPEEVEEGAGE